MNGVHRLCARCSYSAYAMQVPPRCTRSLRICAEYVRHIQNGCAVCLRGLAAPVRSRRGTQLRDAVCLIMTYKGRPEQPACGTTLYSVSCDRVLQILVRQRCPAVGDITEDMYRFGHAPFVSVGQLSCASNHSTRVLCLDIRW